MAAWNAKQYLKFADERTRPAADLAARIPTDTPRRIVDIGCGPGNSTAVLARRFPEARVLGIDNSREMIDAARAAYPELEFACCDAATELETLGTDFDVVFSNACIQWVPDHPALIPRMLGLLRKGGTLAVQIPHNFDEPIHRIIAEVSATWLSGRTPRVFYTLTPGEYYDILTAAASSVSLWEATYFHTMRSHEDIMEWYRGTGLRPYLSLLSEAERPAFERDVYERVAAAYPKQKNGDILFRFPRLFLIAVR
jgi:trans-aconitate 2-methyltransferase